MTSKKVYLDWDAEELFTVHDEEGRRIPVNMGRGFGSSDLLVASLIGCSSYDVVEILRKQRQELDQLKVTAEAVQDEDPPWKFRKIHIHYQAIGRGLDSKKVEKAIQLSEEKYCSVYATLRDVIEITHDFEVIEGK